LGRVFAFEEGAGPLLVLGADLLGAFLVAGALIFVSVVAIGIEAIVYFLGL
jgi:hypothetical protein